MDISPEQRRSPDRQDEKRHVILHSDHAPGHGRRRGQGVRSATSVLQEDAELSVSGGMNSSGSDLFVEACFVQLSYKAAVSVPIHSLYCERLCRILGHDNEKP